jgi:hypothetical protein
MTNYMLFLSDPEEAFTDEDNAQDALNDLIADAGLGSVRIGAQTEAGRIEELEGMINGEIDQWAEVQDLVTTLFEDSAYWNHPPLDQLATWKKLVDTLDIETRIKETE